MSETLKPETAEQVLDAVKWAAASESPLAVRGRGSKDAFGRPVEADHTLDLSGLAGIGCYEPNELFMTAGAATTLAEIEVVMRELRDNLDIEPPRIDGLLNIRGVIDLVEEEDSAEQREARTQAVLAGLDGVLDGLTAARDQEGARLAAVLDSQLDEIAGLVEREVIK